MPAEIRYIVFAEEEVAEAVQLAANRSGKIVETRIETDPEFVVSLRILNGGNQWTGLHQVHPDGLECMAARGRKGILPRSVVLHHDEPVARREPQTALRPQGRSNCWFRTQAR